MATAAALRLLLRRQQRPLPFVAYRSCLDSGCVQSKFHFYSSNTATTTPKRCGAWTLLAALEKSKEAENVKVAHLVSSLGYLVAREQFETTPSTVSQQHTLPQPSHSSDPAFFSLDSEQLSNIGKPQVLALLQSTLRGRRIDLRTVEALIKAATQHFQENTESVVVLPKLHDQHQVTVVGDLHGSLTDLSTALNLMGDPSPQNHVVFNGDLADRGDHGMEVVSIVCALVLAYPNYVHINRGNHEDLALSVAYGLATEVQHKYGTASFRQYLAPLLDDFFRSLPIMTVVEQDALIVHAGPPPPGVAISSMKELLEYDHQGLLSSRTVRVQPEKQPEAAVFNNNNSNIVCVGSDMILEACLWSDPDIEEYDGTLVTHNNTLLKPNISRGAGFKFDAKLVKEVLQAEGLSRLIRSHEPVQKGCHRYAVDDTNMELFTVFSASHYPYKQGFNLGAILKLQANQQHTIVRYSTEEDEPMVHANVVVQQDVRPPPPTSAIRKALQDAIATRRTQLELELDQAASLTQHGTRSDIPFRQSMEILVNVLNLEGEGLLQDGPMRALAQALTVDEDEDDEDEMNLDTFVLPDALDILEALEDAAKGDDDTDNIVLDNNTSTTSSLELPHGWLKAIFAMVDANNDDEIDKTEWEAAVQQINDNLPPLQQQIDAETTWQWLDRNGDGRISAKEWSTLAAITCRLNE